jgi:hypothetical protein
MNTVSISPATSDQARLSRNDGGERSAGRSAPARLCGGPGLCTVRPARGLLPQRCAFRSHFHRGNWEMRLEESS